MSWRMLLILSPLALVGLDVTPPIDLPENRDTRGRPAIQRQIELTDRQIRAMRDRDSQLTARELAEITLLQNHYAAELGLELPPAAP